MTRLYRFPSKRWEMGKRKQIPSITQINDGMGGADTIAFGITGGNTNNRISLKALVFQPYFVNILKR